LTVTALVVLPLRVTVIVELSSPSPTT
jgi:hypothetical protein